MTTGRNDDFRVDVAVGGPTAHVTVRGEVDLVSAPTFRHAADEALSAAGVTTIVFDLSECTWFDSSGLRVLAHVCRECDTRVTVVVTGASGIVKRVLQLTNMDDLLVLDDEAANGRNGSVGEH